MSWVWSRWHRLVGPLAETGFECVCAWLGYSSKRGEIHQWWSSLPPLSLPTSPPPRELQLKRYCRICDPFYHRALQLHPLYSRLPFLCSETSQCAVSNYWGHMNDGTTWGQYTKKEICWMRSITSSWWVTNLNVHILACRYLLTSASCRQGSPPSKNCTKLLQSWFVHQVKALPSAQCLQGRGAFLFIYLSLKLLVVVPAQSASNENTNIKIRIYM